MAKTSWDFLSVEVCGGTYHFNFARKPFLSDEHIKIKGSFCRKQAPRIRGQVNK